MGVNYYFCRRCTNRTHATPNYVPVKYRFEVDYYRQEYFSLEKEAHIREKWKNQVKNQCIILENQF